MEEQIRQQILRLQQLLKHQLELKLQQEQTLQQELKHKLTLELKRKLQPLQEHQLKHPQIQKPLPRLQQILRLQQIPQQILRLIQEHLVLVIVGN